MTFADWVKMLAAVGSLGAIAAAITAIVKRAFGFEGVQIRLLSALLAAIINVLATLAVPYLGQLPPVIEQFWPVLVWIAGQIWYESEWIIRQKLKARREEA